MSIKLREKLLNDKLGLKGAKTPLLLLVAALTISGCASNPGDDAVDIDDIDTSEVDESTGYGFDGADSDAESAEIDQGAYDPDLNLRQNTVFYFDYDLSDLQPDAFEPLKAHARYLVQNPGVIVRLEGHCDERGTREYNIALGERRAAAVGTFLKVQGVSSGQIEMVSYGEERPASYGHDAEAWAQNRRVELYY